MTATPPAWTDEHLADPHAVADKAQRVRQMFSAIAPTYDLNNRLHSLWRDQSWRRAAVEMARVQPADIVLDVACGTGDLAMAFANGRQRAAGGAPAGASQGPSRGGGRRVLGVDFTCEMLTIARDKAEQMGTAPPLYHAGDAMRLPVADQSVDIVSIAFGIRNVARPEAAFREFHRVLRRAGRLVILEFGLPTNRLLRGLYNLYFRHVLPRTAALIARDRSGAYKYLPQSVHTFLDRDAMMAMLRAAGFSDTTAKPLTAGIALIYRGVKS